MKRVLLTGGSGFIGRNIRKPLSEYCLLYAPSRKELNLLDETAVRQYIQENQIAVVIHSANPNPVKNTLDAAESMFEDSLRIFMNLYQAQPFYERMYTLGSGAEYDKSRDITLIREEEAGRSLPYDSYGLSKFIMNQLTAGSEKICNLRIFGCYGATDHFSKFITHCIHCCMKQEKITIRQDCYFDYMQVQDLAEILNYFIYHVPKFRAYNVCTGTRILLSEIAGMVREQMHSDCKIVLLQKGLNREYTGNNSRLLQEIGDFSFTPLRDGIQMQIRSELNITEKGKADETQSGRYHH